MEETLLNTSEILSHIAKQIAAGEKFNRTKRMRAMEHLRLYTDRNRDTEKVSDNSVYAGMQAFLALIKADETMVEFVAKSQSEEAFAQNITDLANFDKSLMNLDQINFQKDWDRAFFGVGIRIKTGWDEQNHCPIWQVKDPLSWIGDPHGNHIDPFEFHYFEEEMDPELMNEEFGFFEAMVAQATTGIMGFCKVYNGYTKWNGKRYSITVSADKRHLLRMVELTADENGHFEDLVNLSYFSPLRGDPYGISLPDLLEDKQRANSILLNLRLIDAKFATFGQMNLFDSRAVNKNDLAAPTLSTKWIAFDSAVGVPISQAVYPVPRSNLGAESAMVSNELAERIKEDSGLDGTDQEGLARRLGLDFLICEWAEKAFWLEWYRSYVRYFSPHTKKRIRIKNAL